MGFDAAEPGRPALAVSTVARILDLPDQLTGKSSVTLTTVTSAVQAELVVDGKSLGKQTTPKDQFGSLLPVEWEVPTSGVADDCIGVQSFPHNASLVQCMNLAHVKSATDSASCAAACCEQNHCNTWQFDVGPAAVGCWVGYAAIGSCVKRDSAPVFEGGQRDAPPVMFFNSATLNALDSDGKVLATHKLHTPAGAKRRLHLTIDVPSPSTGTGKALLLDGRDAALLRASVVEEVDGLGSVAGLFLAADSEKEFALVSSATDRITWRVVSGPGRVAGVSNGDEASHEWMKNNAINAFGGLARGVIQVTQDCVTANRDLAKRIDVDDGRADVSVVVDSCESVPIVVEASAEGFDPVDHSCFGRCGGLPFGCCGKHRPWKFPVYLSG